MEKSHQNLEAQSGRMAMPFHVERSFRHERCALEGAPFSGSAISNPRFLLDLPEGTPSMAERLIPRMLESAPRHLKPLTDTPPQTSLLMPIIQYVLPSRNKQIKKMLHFYWE